MTYSQEVESNTTKKAISSALKLASNNIEIESLKVENIQFLQKKDTGSPF